ncbi:MAG: peptidylprolyl isomerase [Syntrophomonadaceae bacterium]|jgi:cyclophilin family peptidyl-prolyl cis-trans isomerase|nr:peptidylprolyl isomerase [Syntrophomonadaceae bacterium]MDH7497299.1 peptidylprolyl isomerase [Syntrophomonadaceae bacterium]
MSAKQAAKKAGKGSWLADRRVRLWLGAGLVLMVALAAALSYSANRAELEVLRRASIVTDRGTIQLELYPRQMPKTVANFSRLVKEGFYDGLTFHRVEDWVVQGGDPKGDGTGGPGWTIPLETDESLKNVRGAVAMARGPSPDSAGSQFYILKKDAPWLDGQYAVFGRVVAGMDVVDALQAGDVMRRVR